MCLAIMIKVEDLYHLFTSSKLIFADVFDDVRNADRIVLVLAISGGFNLLITTGSVIGQMNEVSFFKPIGDIVRTM